jgi:coproporphyrinogen III oxidase
VNLAAVETYLLGLQQNIVSALEVAGNQSFLRDEWIRTEGGGGISRLIEGGDLFERAGASP